MTIPEKLQRLKLSEKIPSNPPDEDDEPPPIPPTRPSTPPPPPAPTYPSNQLIPPTRPSTPPPPPAPTYPSNQLVVRPPTAPMWDAAVDVFEYPPSYQPRYQPTSVRMQPVMVQTQRGPVAMIPMHQQLPQPRAHYAVQTEQVTTIGTALGGAGHVVDVPVHAAASAPAVLFTAAAALHPAAGGRLPAASGGVTAAPVAVLVRELLALS